MRLSPRTVDVAIAAPILVIGVAETLTASTVTDARWATALTVAAMSLLVLWRRTHAVAACVLLVVLVVLAAALLSDPTELVAPFLPLLILCFSAGAHADLRGAVVALGALLVGVVAVALLAESGGWDDVVYPGVLLSVVWLAGRTVRTRSRHAAELHELAALAAERREQEAQTAVADERRRIAREMHDVVAHSISIMVVQAGGARRILATDPGRAEQAAARIRRAGSDALAEMSILLGVLEAGAEEAVPPGLDSLSELVDRARAAGLPVDLEVTGTPTALPAGAEVAIYRVVQEALTNAVKHAGGASTQVELAWGGDELVVRVADRGDGGPSPQLAGAGHGLIGMRERMRVHGGRVEAGPRDAGGFEVVARLPLARREAGVR